MTQIIWYRSQTAPEPGEEAQVAAADFSDHDAKPRGTGSVDASGRYVAGWEQEKPDARFITIAPMHLREAFWTKISRPIKGVMYHGWQSLVDKEGSVSSYRYTNPDTKAELRRLVNTVIDPLGPTLSQVPDAPTDVAFLESFASQMFAGRGTWGWNGGWAGDAYLTLNYAQLQPRIVYDQTVEREGLDGYKVLVAADCDVLPQTVVDRIRAWQAEGGLVVGDDHLCPAISPDILLRSYTRPKEADMARAAMMEAAQNLRDELDPLYKRYAASTEPSVTTRVRRYGAADYVFAINDLREFGTYVGHHGLVMENGLPVRTKLFVNRPMGYVYDLVAHRQVPSNAGAGFIEIPTDLAPCDGQLFMVIDRAIGGITAEAPQQVTAGSAAEVSIAVVYVEGQPLDAVMPVQVDVLDPAGRPAEGSGYYGARGGKLSITCDIAANDTPGLWRVHVTDLASGLEGDMYVRVVEP